MAGSNFDLSVTIKAVTEQFTAAMTAAKDKIAGFFSAADKGTAAGANLGRISEEAQKADKAAAGLGSGFGKLQGALAALGAAQAVREFIRLNSELEGQRNALTSILGSQEAAIAKMEAMRATGDRLGQSALGLTQQYISLAAATKGTALEGQATDQIFSAVVGAMGKLGKSSEETARALAAVSQMASKGVVSAEEMRGQLGEALPGAMQALSNATGIAVADLNKMMESGHLLASDVLPALAKGLNDAFGTDAVARVDSLGAAMERLQNAAVGAATDIGQAGVSAFASWLADKTTQAITGLTAGTVALGRNVGATAAYAAGAIPTWEEYTQAITENNQAGQESIDQAAGLTQAAAGQSEALAVLASSALKAAQTYGEAAQKAEKYADTVQAQGEATTSAARAELARAKVLGEQAGVLQATEALERAELKAKQDNAQAAEALAKITRDRISGLQEEIAALQQAAAAGQIDAKAAEEGAKAKGKQVEALEKTLASQVAAADKAKELAAAQEAETQQAKINTLTHGDQAEALDALVAARDKATKAVAKAKEEVATLAARQEWLKKTESELLASQAEGLEVTEALAKVQAELVKTTEALPPAQAKATAAATAFAVAQAQVADAARDSQAALEREIGYVQREADLRSRSRDLLVQDLTHRRDLALARHQESAAAQLTVQLYEQEIRQMKDAAAAKEQEAILLGRKAEAKRIEAEATDTYTDAERAEVAALHDAAYAAKLEADALDQQAAFKRDAIHETERLAEAERLLKEATAAVSAEVQKASTISEAAAQAAQKAGDEALKQAEAEGDLQHATERAAKAAADAAEAQRLLELHSRKSAITLEGTGAALDALGDYADIARARFDQLVGSSQELAVAISTNARQANTLLGRFADIAMSAARAAKGEAEMGQALDALQGKLDSGEIGLSDYTRRVEALRVQYGYLGEERLGPLLDALTEAKRRTEELTESAQDALDGLQERLDRMHGNEIAIAVRDRAQELADLQKQLNEAVKAGNVEAQTRLREAIALAEQYWAEYIAGLQRADQAGKNSTLPGIGDGSIKPPGSIAPMPVVPGNPGGGTAPRAPVYPIDTRPPPSAPPGGSPVAWADAVKAGVAEAMGALRGPLEQAAATMAASSSALQAAAAKPVVVSIDGREVARAVQSELAAIGARSK